jgi:hypothetical protein
LAEGHASAAVAFVAVAFVAVVVIAVDAHWRAGSIRAGIWLNVARYRPPMRIARPPEFVMPWALACRSTAKACV